MIWAAVVGAALGTLVGWLGRRTRYLTAGGAAVLALSCAIVSGATSWAWGALVAFVALTIALWQGYALARMPAEAGALPERPRRDWAQVVAMTGWPVVLALLNSTAGLASLTAALVGALATTAADGWATPLGMLSPRRPRLISTSRPVSRGTAGAVSALGTVAALAAAWLVGFLASLLGMVQARLGGAPWDPALRWLPLAAALGGLGGSLVDSLLGATAQAIYLCDRCDARTEERLCPCGGMPRQIRGWSWMTDEAVDLVSAIVGAAASAATLALLARAIG